MNTFPKSIKISTLLLLSGAFACTGPTISADAGPVMDGGTDSFVDVRPSDVSQDGIIFDDGGADGGTDGGTGTDPWAWCPDPEDYVGDDAWTDRVHVGDSIWCVPASQSRSLEDDLAGKRRFWLVPGNYAFPPRTPGTGAMTLPVCMEVAEGPGPEAQDGSFAVSVGDGRASMQLSIPFATGPALRFEMARTDGAPMLWPGLRIDSSMSSDDFFVAPGQSIGSLSYGPILVPCNGLDEWDSRRVAVTFSGGGNVTFVFKAEVGRLTNERSGGFRVTGEINGTAFDVDDYFRIFYAPAHHHFGGDYAVFFERPIGEACGLRLRALGGEPSAALVDCELQAIETLTVDSITGLH